MEIIGLVFDYSNEDVTRRQTTTSLKGSLLCYPEDPDALCPFKNFINDQFI